MILFVRMNDDSVSGDMYLTSVVVSTMNVHIQQKNTCDPNHLNQSFKRILSISFLWVSFAVLKILKSNSKIK